MFLLTYALLTREFNLFFFFIIKNHIFCQKKFNFPLFFLSLCVLFCVYIEEDINLNSRLFLWPSELEKVLDLSGARLAVVRENLETALKERRAQFEQYLIQEKKKMDSFRLRDVREVLSVEDLKEKVATVDGLMETLEVAFLVLIKKKLKIDITLIF